MEDSTMNRYLLLLSLSLVPGWFGHEGTAASSSEQAPRSLSGQAELREFLNCRLVPRLGNAWDYTFAPGEFPRIEWDRPEVVEKVMGARRRGGADYDKHLTTLCSRLKRA
jgi:hypothetical protein